MFTCFGDVDRFISKVNNTANNDHVTFLFGSFCIKSIVLIHQRTSLYLGLRVYKCQRKSKMTTVFSSLSCLLLPSLDIALVSKSWAPEMASLFTSSRSHDLIFYVLFSPKDCFIWPCCNNPHHVLSSLLPECRNTGYNTRTRAHNNFLSL